MDSRHGSWWAAGLCASLAVFVSIATGCGRDGSATTESAATPAGRQAAVTCPPPGARVRLASRNAYVFERVGRLPNKEAEVFGCAGKRGRPVFLGAGRSCFSADPNVGSVKDIRLRGRLAAYSAQMCEGSSPAGTVVRVMHLSERRLLLRASAFGTPNNFVAVTDVEFGPRATVAWIVTQAGGQATPELRVNMASYAGPGCGSDSELTCPVLPVEQLDSGTDIAPDSLASSGDQVYWSRGGAPQSWAP